jgi:hypothetical protein
MDLEKPQVQKLAPDIATLFLPWSIHLLRYHPATLTTFASLPEVMHNSPKIPILTSDFPAHAHLTKTYDL